MFIDELDLLKIFLKKFLVENHSEIIIIRTVGL